MAANEVERPGWRRSVAASNPTTPASGDAVRFGTLTGVAVTDEDADGNTTVDFGPAAYNLSVDDNEGTAIAVGAALYYHDTGTGSPSTHINNTATGGFLFGYAFGTVSTNGTSTIEVQHAAL